MDNKKLYIGLGVLAVAGIGFYLWKKNQEVTEEKANAFGRSFGSGKMAKVDCPVGCSCNNGQINCFASNAIGRFGNVGVGISPIGTQVTAGACTADEIAKGKITCNYKGGTNNGCCNAPKPQTTGTVTVSGANGYMNSVNNPMYNDLTLLVDPANQ